MKTQNLFIIATLSIATLSSCSSRLSYFTQSLYDQYRWTDSELKKIQFYVSDDIVLTRELTGSTSEIISGKIKLEGGRKVEEVVIRKGTPGAFVFSPKNDRFAISFENSDDHYLMFGPSPKFNDRYVLLASEWGRKQGSVTYDNKTWRVSSQAAFAALLVDLRKVNNVDVNSKVVKGRKIG